MAYIRSQGSSIWRQDPTASPITTYVRIGQVTSISGPSGAASTIDVTHLASTGREFLQALPDFGTVQLSVIFDNKTASLQHDDLWDDFNTGTTRDFQIRLSNSPQTTFTFQAFVQEMPISIEIDDKVGATITLKVTGAVTLA